MTGLPPIWFLRHGETEWNLEKRIQGRLDSPLTTRGVAQAHAQARLMAGIIPEVLHAGGGLFVSPQGRAQATARIALAGYDITTDARLAEIDTGDWEGQLRSEVVGGQDGLAAYAAAPGGEGYAGLSGRVTEFLAELRAPAVIVSHGILGQVMRGVVCGLAPQEMAALSNHQGCAYLLQDGRETLLREGADA
ncbi:histidine phosphatase family protein [Roseovarius sp. C7]|uniref:histidine phosphatase family protein n=1 Tax=Roseovarius sp. C7 TaxID=3398643 RepID=UPI0039F5090E